LVPERRFVVIIRLKYGLIPLVSRQVDNFDQRLPSASSEFNLLH
jgi:hypothetical protein